MPAFFQIPLMVEIHPSSTSTYTFKPAGGSNHQSLALHSDNTTVDGSVTVRPKDDSGRSVRHGGISIALVGTIQTTHTYSDTTREFDFLSYTHELADPGEINHPTKFKFEFKHVQKEHESYAGTNIRVIYLLRVIVSKPGSGGFGFGLLGSGDLKEEQEIWVHNYPESPESDMALVRTGSNGTSPAIPKKVKTLKMDVGIEDCLHLEIEYTKSRFHLQDVIVGRVYFLLVRLRIKFMEISLVRDEVVGTRPNQQIDSDVLVRFEIMDGQPAKGDTIPIRLFLGGFDLSPTTKPRGGRYAVKYYMCVVLVDEDARRYFKRSEIILYRQPLSLQDPKAGLGAKPPSFVHRE